ncbi:hypothetical protein CVN56_23830 [Rhodococcus sp. AQ5-07]|nr:hypothetical protein CBI33_20460 [Rhodococcus erythropolis]RAL32442.1 hypothetical protein CVN56_23830 [Rhodococcus sp. AQ5-07]
MIVHKSTSYFGPSSTWQLQDASRSSKALQDNVIQHPGALASRQCADSRFALENHRHCFVHQCELYPPPRDTPNFGTPLTPIVNW